MKRFLIALVLGVSLLFVGCNGKTVTTADEYFQRYQHIIRLAVQVGVVNVLEVNPTYDDKLMAMANIMQSVVDANAILDFGVVREQVVQRIDWSQYKPTERLLVEAILDQMKVELTKVLEADCSPVAGDTRALCFSDLPEVPEKVKMYTGIFSQWIKEGVGVWRAGATGTSRALIPVLPPIK